MVQFVAALTQQVDIIHQHNTVLHHDTYQQHQSQCTDHIQRAVRYPQSHNHTGQGKRHGEHNDCRHSQTLKLRSHRDINQQNNQRSQQNHVAERILLRLVRTAYMRGVTYRQIKLRNNLRLNLLSQLTQRNLIRSHLDGYDTLTALALNRRRCPILANLCHLAQFDHLARRRRDRQIQHVGDRVAVFFFQTNYNVVLRTVVLQVTTAHTRHTVTQIR